MNPQGITFNGVLEGVSTRQDRSLTLRVSTSELTGEEKVLVLNLQEIAAEITIRPLESDLVPKEVKSELQKKSHSERLRNVLFCWWKHLGEPGQFDDLYRAEVEKYITQIKNKLPPPTI